MPQNLVDELNADSSTSKTTAKREVLLDALGNVPLKLYDVNFDNIDDIATSSWTPQMSLTDEERKVVEAKGTVLLLGRSGTGKTIVSSIICAQNKSVHKMCTKICCVMSVRFTTNDLAALFNANHYSSSHTSAHIPIQKVYMQPHRVRPTEIR